MRKLVILIGPPGVGKSTFIKKNNLEKYTISSDKIRLLFQSPIINIDGNEVISQKNDKYVWKFIEGLIEKRMIIGDFIIVDATHASQKSLSKYKKLINKYNYEIYGIDFRNISLNEILKRNEQRKGTYNYVNESIIKNMYENLQNMNIPDYIKLIKPEEFKQKVLNLDTNINTDKVIAIGDLHGSYEEFLELKDKIGENFNNENIPLIFLGDYFDRYYKEENLYLLFEELYNIMNNRKNVYFLLGNHEYKINIYIEEIINDLKEFSEKEIVEKYSNKSNKERVPVNTITTFIKLYNKFGKEKLIFFYKNLKEILLFKNNNNYLFLSHAGFSTIPKVEYNTYDYVYGVGKHEDTEHIINSWFKNTPNNYFQIFGHRDIYGVKNKFQNKRSVVINGDAEILPAPIGSLKAVSFNFKNQKFNYIEVHSKRPELSIEEKTKMNLFFQQNILKMAKQHSGIRIKENNFYGNPIYSLNFTSEIFRTGEFDDFTIKARGLFVDEKGKIVVRGYNKFFNIGEKEYTKLENLTEDKIEYPIQLIEKANGFLGLLSVYNGKWFISTKTSTNSEYVLKFKELITPFLNDRLKHIIEKENITLTFEVIDHEFDPHIEEYKTKQLVLLDGIKNQLDFEKVGKKRLNKIFNLFNKNIDNKVILRRPKKKININSYHDLLKFIEKVNQHPLFSSNGIEGYVISTQDTKEPFMTKLKTDWYKFWKKCRTLKNLYKKHINNHKQLLNIRKDLNDDNLKQFFDFLSKNYNSNNLEELKNKSIIDLRNEFLNSLNLKNNINHINPTFY